MLDSQLVEFFEFLGDVDPDRVEVVLLHIVQKILIHLHERFLLFRSRRFKVRLLCQDPKHKRGKLAPSRLVGRSRVETLLPLTSNVPFVFVDGSEVEKAGPIVKAGNPDIAYVTHVGSFALERGRHHAPRHPAGDHGLVVPLKANVVDLDDSTLGSLFEFQFHGKNILELKIGDLEFPRPGSRCDAPSRPDRHGLDLRCRLVVRIQPGDEVREPGSAVVQTQFEPADSHVELADGELGDDPFCVRDQSLSVSRTATGLDLGIRAKLSPLR